MSEGPELSDLCSELLETARQKPGARIRSGIRERYFLSEGAGMEFWEVLKKQGYSPEELEECKNELKEKDLLSVKKVDEGVPYFSRFKGKLGTSIDFMFPKERFNTGHATMKVTKEREVLELDRKGLEACVNKEQDLPEKAGKMLQKAIQIIENDERDTEEAIRHLDEKGIDPELLEHSTDEDYRKGLKTLRQEGLAEKKTEKYERRKCVRFRSEWVEKEPRTRFFFSPEIYEEYFSID